MRVNKMFGIEMEKETKTSFQDYFNESFLSFIEQGIERTFSVVYLRYFEEKMEEFTPFLGNPVYEVNGKLYTLKDVLAFIYFCQFPDRRNRKRIYISDGEEFKTIFVGFEKSKLEQQLKKLN